MEGVIGGDICKRVACSNSRGLAVHRQDIDPKAGIGRNREGFMTSLLDRHGPVRVNTAPGTGQCRDDECGCLRTLIGTCSTPEILGPVVTIGAGCFISIADPDVAEIRIQDIGPMPRAAHPVGHHGFRRGVAGRNIFAISVPWVTGCRHPVTGRTAIQACVAEIVVHPHVLRMAPGSRGKTGIVTQRPEPRLRSFSIHECQDITFEISMNHGTWQKKTDHEQGKNTFHQIVTSVREFMVL